MDSDLERVFEPVGAAIRREQISGACGAAGEVVEKRDLIAHPGHYTGGKIEVWDFIHDQKLDFLEGNVVKYVCRYKRKNGLEDLLKARQYLEKLIQSLGGQANTTF